jgi:TalC/MipB family fructose-6-phosphate aldolase
MELYLDSVKIDEIKDATALGYLAGLTTTPTFMYRDGIKDIDGTILEISHMVNILMVEALGNSAGETVNEALRLVSLGLDPKKTVFKIPISLEGTKACKMLVDKGLMVNLHLIYTVQQAYMAFCAGATYVCPLVGRLQDQGHDALGLIKDCVNVVEKYHYQSKIMFSSVRNIEHVKNALNLGAHACTIPWPVLRSLTENHFTKIGTDEFLRHTNLLSTKVIDITRKKNVTLAASASVAEALLEMTKSKVGAVLALNSEKSIHRIFTDGDLRRILETKGENIMDIKLADLPPNNPQCISPDECLLDAQKKFKEVKVDTLVVKDGDEIIGLVDIQDVI